MSKCATDIQSRKNNADALPKVTLKKESILPKVTLKKESKKREYFLSRDNG
ncbi:hypothetical protein LTSESEN_0729 [Salmonella enterica subsp. enterica serovar Senftenberg str. A4-543]|uniref:Uncharacterized protein n=1 Tax=Salmonella enterica subsp. enterica serovar Senftenberg str. A4-543 TaxID=913082 RepID=G5QVQ1_SALSE|nr:hypothetical protein LTSESEN_0729 [Salmonella enterica subsp. enterica serovar Senftenberg str. A4-543]